MKRTSGFTLVELSLVICMIAVLAAVAIPQFGLLLAKTKEAVTKGNLATIRSAIAIYYSDNDGRYPVDALTSLIQNQKYIRSIPIVYIPDNRFNKGLAPSNSVCTSPSCRGSGGWGYESNPIPVTDVEFGEFPWGTVVPNAVLRDSRGDLWCLK